MKKRKNLLMTTLIVTDLNNFNHEEILCIRVRVCTAT